MRPQVLPFTLIVLVAAIAGCIGDEGPGVSKQGSHTHGNYYICPDGTKIDPGAYSEHHDPDFDPKSKCPEKTEPARVNLALTVTELTVFDSINLTWDVTPRTGADGVAESTALIVTDPDGNKTSVGEKTNAETPGTFETGWTPERAGTYTLQAQAVFAGKTVTSGKTAVTVKQLPPTGIKHEIIIEPIGPTAKLNPATITIKAGDAVYWINDDLLAHALRSTTTPDDAEGFETGQLQSGQTSAEVLFLIPGTYKYANDSGDGLQGTITVERPSA